MSNMDALDINRPRSVGEIIAATLRVYRRYPLLFAILALAVMAPYELLVLAITGYGPLRHTHESASAGWLLILTRAALITPLVSALHMHAVVAIGEGRAPRLRVVALRGLQVLPVVAAAAIMSAIGIFAGFVALIVPGIVLWLRWAVVAQAASVEGQGWLAALRSSARLTAGHYSHVFGLLLVTALISEAVRIGVWAIPLGSTAGVASVAAGVAVDTVLASFTALTLALLYFELKVRPTTTEVMQAREREHPHLRDLD
jgi:hypothetical protein